MLETTCQLTDVISDNCSTEKNFVHFFCLRLLLIVAYKEYLNVSAKMAKSNYLITSSCLRNLIFVLCKAVLNDLKMKITANNV